MTALSTGILLLFPFLFAHTCSVVFRPGRKKREKGKKRSQRKREKRSPSLLQQFPRRHRSKKRISDTPFIHVSCRGGERTEEERKNPLSPFLCRTWKSAVWDKKINKYAKMVLLPRTRLWIKQTIPFSTKLDSALKWFLVASGRICSLRAFGISVELRMSFS